MPNIHDMIPGLDPPKSAMPAGGKPSDDAAYRAWREAFVERENARVLDRYDWRFDMVAVMGLIAAWKLDLFIFNALSGPLQFEWYTYSHKQRHLAIALRDQRQRVERLAREYVALKVSEYEGRS